MEDKTNHRVTITQKKSQVDVGALDLRVSELETKLSEEIFQKEDLLSKNKKLEETVKQLTSKSETLVDASVI